MTKVQILTHAAPGRWAILLVVVLPVTICGGLAVLLVCMPADMWIRGVQGHKDVQNDALPTTSWQTMSPGDTFNVNPHLEEGQVGLPHLMKDSEGSERYYGGAQAEEELSFKEAELVAPELVAWAKNIDQTRHDIQLSQLCNSLLSFQDEDRAWSREEIQRIRVSIAAVEERHASTSGRELNKKVAAELGIEWQIFKRRQQAFRSLGRSSPPPSLASSAAISCESLDEPIASKSDAALQLRSESGCDRDRLGTWLYEAKNTMVKANFGFFTPAVVMTDFSPAQLDVGLQDLALFRSLAPPVVVEDALLEESPGAPWGFRPGRKSAPHQVQPQALDLVGPMHASASAATESQEGKDNQGRDPSMEEWRKNLMQEEEWRNASEDAQVSIRRGAADIDI